MATITMNDDDNVKGGVQPTTTDDKRYPSLAQKALSHSMAAFRHHSTYEVYWMGFSARVVTVPTQASWLNTGETWPWMPVHELLIRLHCLRRHWEFWFDGSGALPKDVQATTSRHLIDRAKALACEPSLDGLTLGELEALVTNSTTTPNHPRGKYHMDYRIAKRALEEDVRVAGTFVDDETKRLTQYIRAYLLFCAKMLMLDEHCACSSSASSSSPSYDNAATRVRAMALRLLAPSPGMPDPSAMPTLLREMGVPDVVFGPPAFPPADPAAAAFLDVQQKANRVFAESQRKFDHEVARLRAHQEPRAREREGEGDDENEQGKKMEVVHEEVEDMTR